MQNQPPHRHCAPIINVKTARPGNINTCNRYGACPLQKGFLDKGQLWMEIWTRRLESVIYHPNSGHSRWPTFIRQCAMCACSWQMSRLDHQTSSGSSYALCSDANICRHNSTATPAQYVEKFIHFMEWKLSWADNPNNSWSTCWC